MEEQPSTDDTRRCLSCAMNVTSNNGLLAGCLSCSEGALRASPLKSDLGIQNRPASALGQRNRGSRVSHRQMAELPGHTQIERPRSVGSTSVSSSAKRLAPAVGVRTLEQLGHATSTKADAVGECADNCERASRNQCSRIVAPVSAPPGIAKFRDTTGKDLASNRPAKLQRPRSVGSWKDTSITGLVRPRAFSNDDAHAQSMGPSSATALPQSAEEESTVAALALGNLSQAETLGTFPHPTLTKSNSAVARPRSSSASTQRSTVASHSACLQHYRSSSVSALGRPKSSAATRRKTRVTAPAQRKQPSARCASTDDCRPSSAKAERDASHPDLSFMTGVPGGMDAWRCGEARTNSRADFAPPLATRGGMGVLHSSPVVAVIEMPSRLPAHGSGCNADEAYGPATQRCLLWTEPPLMQQSGGVPKSQCNKDALGSKSCAALRGAPAYESAELLEEQRLIAERDLPVTFKKSTRHLFKEIRRAGRFPVRSACRTSRALVERTNGDEIESEALRALSASALSLMQTASTDNLAGVGIGLRRHEGHEDVGSVIGIGHKAAAGVAL